jgi:hypothetical protein
MITTMITLASALIGVVLGLRFRALVLVPVILTATVAIAGFSIAQGYNVGETLGAIVLAAVAIQLGYVATSIRFVRAMRRSRVPKDGPSPTALSGSAR